MVNHVHVNPQRRFPGETIETIKNTSCVNQPMSVKPPNWLAGQVSQRSTSGTERNFAGMCVKGRRDEGMRMRCLECSLRIHARDGAIIPPRGHAPILIRWTSWPARLMAGPQEGGLAGAGAGAWLKSRFCSFIRIGNENTFTLVFFLKKNDGKNVQCKLNFIPQIFLIVSHLYQASPFPGPLPQRPLPHTPACFWGCFAIAVAENRRSIGQKKTGRSSMATQKIHSVERFVKDFIFLNFNSFQENCTDAECTLRKRNH